MNAAPTQTISNVITVEGDAISARPTPECIDQTIADYEVAVRTAKVYQDAADDLKQHLILLVENFGQVPSHAEQSKRLEGRRNTATITRGTTVTVNEPAVAELGCYLSDENLFDLFPRFFVPQTKHTLVEGAVDVLKSVKLARRTEEKIASLFGRSILVKTKAPSLKVELIQAEKPVRKPRGGRAAA